MLRKLFEGGVVAICQEAELLEDGFVWVVLVEGAVVEGWLLLHERLAALEAGEKLLLLLGGEEWGVLRFHTDGSINNIFFNWLIDRTNSIWRQPVQLRLFWNLQADFGDLLVKRH